MTPLTPRSLAFAAVLVSAGLGLGACGGFTPLYAAPGVTPQLASIEVARQDGRTGFLLGQYLDDDFAKSRTSQPAYRLVLHSSQVRIPRGIRVNNVASRYEVDLNTTYTLVDIKTRQTITSGLVKVNVTYDSADQPYAGLAAELDGQQRAAEQSAQRIRLELASYFANPHPGSPSNTAQLAADASLATFSERLQPATVQSPRERALGQPTPQHGASDIFGQPLRSTLPSDADGLGPQAPADPAAPALDPVPDAAAGLVPGQR